jgi:hypothetical protein
VRFNRFFAILAASVILSVLAVTIPVTPALAAPTIALSPTSGTIGTPVTITGENFTSFAGDQIHIYFGSTEVTGSPLTVPVPAGGKFTLTFQVPDDAAPGRILVTVRDKNNNQLGGSAEFVIPKPSIILDKGGGEIGTTVKISGTGFRASQMVTFAYSNHTTIVLGKIAASPIGEIKDYVFTVPESTGKENKVIASDSAGNNAEAIFSVIPSIVLKPVSGAIGDAVTVTGTGFGYQSRITINFGQQQVKTARTDTKGNFETTFKVPDMELQTYNVDIADAEDNTAVASFTINAGKVSFVFPQWGIYALMGLGGLVLFFLGLWLGRKYAYTY